MKLKQVIIVLGLGCISFLGVGIHSSVAYVKNCKTKACNQFSPSINSSSEFFKEDVNDIGMNDLEVIDKDIKAIPVEGQFWPVDGIITGHFGKWRGRRNGHRHAGVDIAAPKGTQIVAPFSGIVSFVGRKGGYGLALIIDHGNGISTLYGHNSAVEVYEGEVIKKGQPISKVGSSGRSTGPHLHYEVRMEGEPVNPLAWTDKLQRSKKKI